MKYNHKIKENEYDFESCEKLIFRFEDIVFIKSNKIYFNFICLHARFKTVEKS